LFLGLIGLAAFAWAGFKVKLVEAKKPEKFQVHVTVDGVTFAADLLLDEKAQKKYFYKELCASDIIALRLAIFNQGGASVVLPLEELQLLGPDGKEIPIIDPLTVADAVLQGRVVSAGISRNPPVAVSPSMRTGDPRLDPSDPRYDPTLDPSRPGYDPSDPRNQQPGTYGGPWGRPGVDVVLNPGGGSRVDLTVHEQALVRKDFQDKCHSVEPILNSLRRDKFLYFSMNPIPASGKGFQLRLPADRGISREITLNF